MRVGITGMAALSAFGAGTRGLGKALRDGAELPGLPAETPLANLKARKMMAPAAYLAARCLADLLVDVGWTEGRDRIGMYLGVGASAGSLADFTALLGESLVDGVYSLERFGQRGLAACNPLLAFQLMNNFTLCHGAILEGIGGPNSAMFSRGAGSIAAIAEAVQSVRSGECERAIAGGADAPTHPATIEELARDGFIGRGLAPADGAALIALERGGAIEILGCGIASGRGRAVSDAIDEAVAAARADSPAIDVASGHDRAIDEAATARADSSTSSHLSGRGRAVDQAAAPVRADGATKDHLSGRAPAGNERVVTARADGSTSAHLSGRGRAVDRAAAPVRVDGSTKDHLSGRGPAKNEAVVTKRVDGSTSAHLSGRPAKNEAVVTTRVDGSTSAHLSGRPAKNEAVVTTRVDGSTSAHLSGRRPAKNEALTTTRVDGSTIDRLSGRTRVTGEVATRIDGSPIDLVVIAPWGSPAEDVLRTWIAAHYPTAVVVSTAALGESLAASAPLALVAAADLLADGSHRHCLVLALGADGDPGALIVARSVGHGSFTEVEDAPDNDQRATSDPGEGETEPTPHASSHRRAPVATVAQRRRAVITGVGAVSAFGVGVEALWSGLAEGRSGISRIRSFDASTFPTHVAGEVPVPRIDAAWLGDAMRDPAFARELGETGALRDRKVAFGLLAAQEAWQMAGCGYAEQRASLVIALGLEQAFLEDLVPIWRDGAIAWARADRSPGVRFRAPVDLTARAIHARLGLQGVTIVNASACAAGTLAVAHAALLIERGADIVVCGGADSMVNPLGLGGMCRLGAPSPCDELDACRPFDRRRDGLVIGEGAAMFIVESEAHAAARGARALATILGWGSTQDGYRTTAPRPDGASARAAMERAIERSGLRADAIGYVNAHGTGTPLNDPAECLALHGALGAYAAHVAVSSIKGAVGHLMAAAGAIEIAASLLAFERDVLPGTANFDERDPECALDIIGREPRRARVDALLSNSFGFGGQNASIVLGRPA